MGFDMAYDEQMIDIFNQFKTEGIDELIIDLRYNPGGMVNVSARSDHGCAVGEIDVVDGNGDVAFEYA